MKTTLKLTVLATLGALYAGTALAADEPAASPPPPATLLEAITGGKPMTNFRLRYEYVDQEGYASTLKRNIEDSNAWTLRSLIGWQTLPFHNFSFAAQLINVTQLNNDFYDNERTFSGRPAREKEDESVVADPNYTNINQLYMDWTGIPATKIRLGRQSVKLDNVRFIGNVEFRQVMQVFDGIAVENKSIPDTEIYLAHFGAVNQISTKRRSGNIDIAHATWKYSPTESLTGYGYFLDVEHNGQNIYNRGTKTITGTGFADNSSRTLGLRADGSHKINDDWKVLYTAEYADQQDYRGGDNRIDAHYWRLGAGAGWGNWYLRLDREDLSSNHGKYGFQTPFGTNHLFQGWGDSFLVTPKQGMEDTFLSFGGKVFNVQLAAEYHWFDSDKDFRTTGDSATHFTGNSYGKELDLSAAYTYDKHWSGKVEYFNYNADDCYTSSTAKGNYVCSNTAKGRSYRDKDNFLVTLMYSF